MLLGHAPLPVIVEDDALIGGNTGVYEDAIVRARAVVGAGTISDTRTELEAWIR